MSTLNCSHNFSSNSVVLLTRNGSLGLKSFNFVVSRWTMLASLLYLCKAGRIS